MAILAEFLLGVSGWINSIAFDITDVSWPIYDLIEWWIFSLLLNLLFKGLDQILLAEKNDRIVLIFLLNKFEKIISQFILISHTHSEFIVLSFTYELPETRIFNQVGYVVLSKQSRSDLSCKVIVSCWKIKAFVPLQTDQAFHFSLSEFTREIVQILISFIKEPNISFLITFCSFVCFFKVKKYLVFNLVISFSILSKLLIKMLF